MVDTLNIGDNAVTVPAVSVGFANNTSVGSSPQVAHTITVDFGSDSAKWPKKVLVMGSVNWFAYTANQSSAHAALAQGNTTSGYQGIVAITTPEGGSGAVTATYMFGAPSQQFQTYSLVSWMTDAPAGHLKYGQRTLVVLGARK